MKFYAPIEIRFRDLDAMAHVNNAVYLSYVEQARIAYFQHVIGSRHNWQKFGVLIVKNQINYNAPIHLEDEVVCGIEVNRIGNKSIEVHFSIEKAIDSSMNRVVCAYGNNVLVCHDHERKETASVPTVWKQKLQAFEQV